jgi:aspartyl-tRNA(Asn)/glutamyl-tRNA(Gln) amidotransferase subunit B
MMSLEEVLKKYEPVIGLEVHAQLKTQSKAFAPEEAIYGALPNTSVSVVTLAHPGVLPKVNKRAFDFAIKMGLACGCRITEYNYFDRKNYFYPDLPKGYQISQDKTPICRGGSLRIKLQDGSTKNIGITRIHIEEDAGKSMHIEGEEESFVDFNRAGVPLIEIVSEPDIRSAEEAYAYLVEIRKLVRYLDICDGNMEEGSLRCDVNVSIRPKGTERFGTRVEVKNLNSFGNVKRAIEFEIVRQAELIEKGESFTQETRMFNAETGQTYSLRTKESLNDYRYFPEPDLTPVYVTQEWIERIKREMPPLPWELFEKFTNQYGLSEYDAEVLTSERDIALYYDEACQYTKEYKAVANWVSVQVKAYLNELAYTIEEFPLKPKAIAELVNLIAEGKITHNIASKQLYPLMLENPQIAPEVLAQQHQLIVNANTDELLGIVKEVIARFPDKVEEYKSGKKGLLGMFMGHVMRATQGKADPKLATRLLQEALERS